MGLASHALALGIGYVLGHPDGRERARKVPDQVRQLAARPEAARLAEKGKSLAGQAVSTAKQRLGRSGGDAASGGTGSTGSGSPTTGDTGRITAGETAAGRRRRLFVRPRRRPGGVDVPTSAEPGVAASGYTGDAPADKTHSGATEAVSERTETAMHGTLPPAGKPRT